MSKQDQAKQEIVDLYQRFYMEGFKTNNIGLIDRIVRYPIAYLKNGVVEMLDHYPVDPAQLKAEKQWDHSTDWHFEVSAINDQNAHVVASATRRRADGSQIERVHAFYDFTRVEGAWKMYAIAEIVF